MGAQVWRTADGVTWSTVVADGFGDTNNYQTGGLAVFGGYLYVGAQSTRRPRSSGVRKTGRIGIRCSRTVWGITTTSRPKV